jgi:hypothetical protein
MKTYPQPIGVPRGSASIENITARLPSPAQSRIGFTPSASVRTACLNEVMRGFWPFRLPATSKTMTPYSLSYFLTLSTRMCVAALHIFCSVMGGKWMYPTADVATGVVTSATPISRLTNQGRS